MLNTDHAKTASGVADYQPAWEHDYDIKLLRTVLAHTAPLVSPEDIDMLRGTLRDAPRDSLVLQVGDCVEDLSEATTEAAEQKSEAIVTLGSALKHQPGGVLLLGRIAGQYAKPRSTPYETANGETFMSFRGPIVHDSRRSSRHRAGNAHRIATCHLASQTTAHAVSTYDATPFSPAGSGPATRRSSWTMKCRWCVNSTASVTRPVQHGPGLETEPAVSPALISLLQNRSRTR